MTQIFTITQEQIDSTPITRPSDNWPLPGVTGPGQYTWNEQRHTYKPVIQAGPVVSHTDDRPYDFDGGFGIGGLGRYQEPIPTEAQLARLEAMEARARYCRRCGQSDVFDGAMFTTGGGDICDDCF